MRRAPRVRRTACAAFVSASLLASAAPMKPFNVAPTAPIGYSQRDGVTKGLSPMLKAGVLDPNGDPLHVSFFGRKTEPAPVGADEATLVVIPDPQNYTKTAASARTYRRQMRWIVQERERLDIAFVFAVGDLVQRPHVPAQWKRASDAWRILDDAGVPYSVLPGNHDMTEHGEASMYDHAFPPERFEQETWYGGWLGDPTDGIPDPAYRGNKDSYQLFSAAGMDFLVLNIEVDLPLDAVAWASDVVDAFPDRHVILATHRWMAGDGVRWRRPLYRVDTPVLSPEQAWTQLVAPQCTIFMVVAGHDPGESRRHDTNDCGRPVFQLMADYQTRPRGGDGWLRLYTIEPDEAEIEVSTYSVTRNGGAGEFERDADSDFTLAWAGSGPPFTKIGSAADVPSGGLAALTWSGLEPGTAYEWYAVASDGSLVSAGATHEFLTP